MRIGPARARTPACLALVAVLVAAMGAVPVAAAPPSIVWQDWYLRESLRAIRDWESILAEWEAATPEEERTPVCPVPSDGSQAVWPNPIPRTLIPVRDWGCTLALTSTDAGMALTRTAPGQTDATEAVPTEEPVLGYKHPGGGGADRWYHPYTRRFDGMSTFTPKSAPFALEVATPRDWLRGVHPLDIGLGNATDRTLSLSVRLGFRSATSDWRRETREVTLAPRGQTKLSFSVDLAEPGGGLVILEVMSGETRYWVPLLTHVEDVTAVLDGVAQVLADRPDTGGQARLAELRKRAAEWSGSGAEWRTLFEEANALRDELLLGRIDFDAMLVVKRKPFDSEQPFMDAHHLRNRPGGAIYRLSPVRPDGTLTPVVDSLGDGIYRDVCLDWDASRLLFSFGNGSDKWTGEQSYHIYEVGADGSDLRQLTSGPKNDCEPFYLPNGQLGFTSDRSEHFVMCGGDRHAPNLFVMEPDGSHPRLLSANVYNDFNPTVMPDGRILYSRWEYNERSVTSLHNPFTMNPDGTMVMPYYGNATSRPNVVMFPRPVPGSRKITALFTAHHGQTHGSVGLIDTGIAMDGMEPIALLTPGVPITAEKHEDSRYGWFSDPVPLSEDTFLCSYTPTVVPWLEWSWALYVADGHGNLALLHRDPDVSLAEPVPLVPRTRPPASAKAPLDTDAADATAELILLDVYAGLTGIERGAARYVRILEDLPRISVLYGGVIVTSGTQIYTVKRVVGTVPLAEDGSARMEVPANRNIYFEVLDRDQREIQRMRSVVCLKPRERRTCIGCHERQYLAPTNAEVRAVHLAEPSIPGAPPWGEKTLSFLRDVQPVLNDRCVRCHTHDRTTNRVILTDDLTDIFSVGYEELLPYLKVANAMRWDYPEDVLGQPPMTYGSRVSPLMRMLDEGHGGVELTPEEDLRLATWVDANGVYYDRYELGGRPNRSIFVGDPARRLGEVYGRRCAECHGPSDGTGGTWWLTLNRRDPALSRMLRAPLARSAGGWQRCGDPVFADTSDPDYQAALAVLTDLRAALDSNPRADLLSLQGDPAETQQVDVPEPPGTTRVAVADPPGERVYLSDLPWVTASAGWTPNGDGLPRIDTAVDGGPLVAGLLACGKGIGTHAPSEIVYDLAGAYESFRATVAAGEAGGTVVFEVYGDGALLYQSPILRGRLGSDQVDVTVTGVRELRLVVTDAGDGIIADCANWINARVFRPL